MIDGKSVLGLVPARAGSKRLPGKNLRPLAGKPLISWTIEAALNSEHIDQVVISTDQKAILDTCLLTGAHAGVARPDELAQDTSSVIDAIIHALDNLEGDWDYVVLLQPTSPLRLSSDIDDAIRLCHHENAPAVVGVTTLPKPEHFLCKIGPGDRLELTGDIVTSAGEPALVRLINGAVYVGRSELVRASRTFAVPGTLAYTMPPERSVDIDTLDEFEHCAAVLRGRSQTLNLGTLGYLPSAYG